MSLGELLDSGAHVVGAEVGVALDHDRRLPATRTLDGVQIDSRRHGEPAGERVPQIVEAEVRNLRRCDRWPPVALEVVEVLAFG